MLDYLHVTKCTPILHINNDMYITYTDTYVRVCACLFGYIYYKI